MTGGRVVILGKTGRNFAAGMSGGIAFVFDPEHALERLCNKDMVDLETMEDEDKAEVRAMVQKHFQYTGSDPAEWIIENWNVASDLFIKVMPKDYKMVLAKQKVRLQPAVNDEIGIPEPSKLKL
jgi:glutamate synthase domain-containing protein 3